jgi:hypothetical protein
LAGVAPGAEEGSQSDSRPRVAIIIGACLAMVLLFVLAAFLLSRRSRHAARDKDSTTAWLDMVRSKLALAVLRTYLETPMHCVKTPVPHDVDHL